MKTFGIDMGHRYTDKVNSGAVGILKEVDVNRAVGRELMKILREAGKIVVDCTDNYSELVGRTEKANKNTLDLYVSLHCNAFNKNAHGVETHVYLGSDRTVAKRVNDSIVKEFKFTDRGVKESNFHVLRETKAPAILIEMFFVDSKIDCDIYNNQYYKMAVAIARGLGVEVNNKPSVNPTVSPSKLYRVRKSWSDSASQKGAYSELSNAKKCADSNKGYYVFDEKGSKVYPIAVTNCEKIINKYTERGKCTITTPSGIKFRDKPCVHSGKITGVYSYKESVNYDYVVITDKYVWISWVSSSTGERRYMPIKDRVKNERWGTCI